MLSLDYIVAMSRQPPAAFYSSPIFLQRLDHKDAWINRKKWCSLFGGAIRRKFLDKDFEKILPVVAKDNAFISQVISRRRNQLEFTDCRQRHCHALRRYGCEWKSPSLAILCSRLVCLMPLLVSRERSLKQVV